jgi:riboflavin biosynthesis pyrimidine reductase
MPVRVPLPLATAAMRLARPIVDGDGLLVAGAGTVLAPNVLRLLRRLGLQSVLVEAGNELPGWSTARPLGDELAALDARVAPEERRGALAELHAAVARHLAARAARLADLP